MMGHRNFRSTSYSTEPISLRLEFSNRISSPVLTGHNIKGEGSESNLEIILVDNHTGQIVTSGPEAHAKVDIVLLNRDFATARPDNDDWTPEEFQNNVVTEWKKKKKFLTGDVQVELKQGRGCVGEIKFKHDRHYVSKFKFRLGARVVGTNFRIKEAKTDPFYVKDRRNELYKKNGRPSLTDEVWRLRKIGKKGPLWERLENENIKTVKDFLDRLYSDPKGLEEIYGSSGSNWKTTVKHAQESNTGAYDEMAEYEPEYQNNVGENQSYLGHYDSNSHLSYVEAHPTTSFHGAVSSNNILTDQATNHFGDGAYHPVPADANFSGQQLSVEHYYPLSTPYFSSENNQGLGPYVTGEEYETGESIAVGNHEDVQVSRAKIQRRWTKLFKTWFSMRSFLRKVGEASNHVQKMLMG